MGSVNLGNCTLRGRPSGWDPSNSRGLSRVCLAWPWAPGIPLASHPWPHPPTQTHLPEYSQCQELRNHFSNCLVPPEDITKADADANAWSVSTSIHSTASPASGTGQAGVVASPFPGGQQAKAMACLAQGHLINSIPQSLIGTDSAAGAVTLSTFHLI